MLSLCFPGYYAPNGSVAQTECETGTYMPYYGASECLVCDPGYYCPDKAMNETIECPLGSYCENGSIIHQTCPPGTFSNQSVEMWSFLVIWRNGQFGD